MLINYRQILSSRIRQLGLMTIAIFFVAITSLAGEVDLDPIEAKYAQQLEKAKQRYIISMNAVRKKMITDYERLLASAMRKQDLEKANEIKRQIEALKGSTSSASPEEAKVPEVVEPKEEKKSLPEKPPATKEDKKVDDGFDIKLPEQPK